MPLFEIKARAPLGDRQCDEQGANLESGGIFYKYMRREMVRSGGSCSKVIRELYDKMTNRNPLNPLLLSNANICILCASLLVRVGSCWFVVKNFFSIGSW
jgi:hypothetical protein